MLKNNLFITFLLFTNFIFSQNEENNGVFISSLGFGYAQRYNEMVLPYELSGANYSINLEWQMLHSVNLLSDAKFNIHYLPLFVKSSAANILALNSIEHCLGFDLEYQLMQKLIDSQNFKLFAGGNLELKPEYEIFIDLNNGNLFEDLTKVFFEMDLSLGMAVFAQYKFNKFRISDNLSFPLIAGAFYPHYQISPFYYPGNYFTIVPIGKLNRISNYLSCEFPIYIKGKLLNTLYLCYNFNYEYSTVRDNIVRRFGHNILLGLRFKIAK
ncbi:MAG: hypothetical protein FWD66_01355 [Paludibacter sp.]|nr:hypothetical protein [Paludibacter sp.]